MQIIGFDFKSFIVLLLSFLGCGRGFNPPEPVVIETPKTITSEKLVEPTADHVLLMFEFNNTGKLSCVAKTNTESSLVSVPIDKQKIEPIITKAQSLAQKQRKELQVVIKQDNLASPKEFKELIAALSAKQIFKFQLSSTPK